MSRALAALLLSACAPGRDYGTSEGEPEDAGPDRGAADLSFTDMFPGVPCVAGSGTHRLYMQGRKAESDALGRWPMYEDVDGCCSGPMASAACCPIVHGEQPMYSDGSFVEWVAPLCADITGHVHFFIPNNENPSTIADVLWELIVLRGVVETVVATARDSEQYGSMGYVPFEEDVMGEDPDAGPGDLLLVRGTNYSPYQYTVVIFNPPSEYMAWVEVDVP